MAEIFNLIETYEPSAVVAKYLLMIEKDNWTGNTYSITNIELIDGDVIRFSVVNFIDRETTIAAQTEWMNAVITYEGDESTNTITLSAETVPTMDIKVLLEIIRDL